MADELYAHMDAANIDRKGCTQDFYRHIAMGDLWSPDARRFGLASFPPPVRGDPARERPLMHRSTAVPLLSDD